MKLQVKIKAKYLDELLTGTKNCEYRQFETITLTDENGRSRVFDIEGIRALTHRQAAKVIEKYSDVPWDMGKQIIKFEVRLIKREKEKRGGESCLK